MADFMFVAVFWYCRKSFRGNSMVLVSKIEVSRRSEQWKGLKYRYLVINLSNPSLLVSLLVFRINTTGRDVLNGVTTPVFQTVDTCVSQH